jgi:hypothetical protein
MLHGLDGKVAQQHVASFFGELGIKPAQVRVVWKQGEGNREIRGTMLENNIII